MSDIQSVGFSPAAGAPAVVHSAPAAPATQAAPAAPVVKAKAAAPAPRVDPQEMQRQLQQAVVELNRQMEHSGVSLDFSIDKSIGRSIVKVVNKDTGELVRQIPSEAVVRVADSIESLKGILYNKSI